MSRIYAFLVIFLLCFPGYSAIALNAAPLDDASHNASQSPDPHASLKKEEPLKWKTSGESSTQNTKKKWRNKFFKQYPNPKTQQVMDKNSSAPEKLKKKSAKNVPSLVELPRTSMPPANAADINRQLQDIIKLNDSLKVNQTSNFAQLQSIQEQAKIHQQILQKLEVSKAATPVLNSADVQEVLRQEKIRLIHEQTSRNREIVKALEQRRRS